MVGNAYRPRCFGLTLDPDTATFGALLEGGALRRHLPDPAALEAREFDLNAWFFGAGGTDPRRLGYSLGHALAGEWRAVESRRDPDTLVNTPAAEVLAVAVPRLSGG